MVLIAKLNKDCEMFDNKKGRKVRLFLTIFSEK